MSSQRKATHPRSPVVRIEHPCDAAERWIRAEPAKKTPSDPSQVGKWLIYLGCRQIARSWVLIARGTSAGNLGVGAKISGHRAKVRRVKHGDEEVELADLLERQEEHVVCVYTRDWRDIDDLERVGRALAKLGAVVNGVLRYKSDAQTMAGVYAGGGPVSLFKMAPPYQQLEADGGLARWGQREPQARAIRQQLQSRR